MPSDDEDEDKAIYSSESEDDEEGEIAPKKKYQLEKKSTIKNTINKSNIPLPSDEEGKIPLFLLFFLYVIKLSPLFTHLFVKLVQSLHICLFYLHV